MLQDGQNLFSNEQAITADAASTNCIDLRHTKDSGPGEELRIAVQVMANFNTLTSLTIKVQTDDNESFSSARDLDQMVVPLADLVIGRMFEIIPRQRLERYVRLYYDVTGSNPTTGKITAAVATKTPRSFHNLA